MKNKTYDVLKFIAQIVLPAIGTLYFALAGIWGFPYGEQVVGTISAVDAFLGALLGISSAQYYKSGKDTDGVIFVNESDETVDFNFGNTTLEELLSSKKTVKLQVEEK